MQELEDSDSAFKELPYYRAIFKSFLRRQIQHLLEELSCETGEESIILTADIMNGTLSHLGSCTGKGFLEGREDIKTQFLSYCLKTYHGQKTHESLSPYQRTHSSPRTSGPSAAKRPRHQQVKPASSIFHKQNRAPIQQAPSTSIEVEPSLTGVTSLEQRVDLARSVKMEKNETEQNTGSPELSLPFLLASTGKVSTTTSAAPAIPALTPPSSASLVNYPHQSYDTPRSSHTQSSADICEDEADGTDSNLEHKSSEIDCGVKEIKREPEDSDDLELTGVDVAGDSSMSLDTWGLSQYGLGTSGTDASPASHNKQPISHQVPIWGVSMTAATATTNHLMMENQSGDIVTCIMCGRSVSRGALRSHMLSHRGVKNFECDFCHKRFTHKATLQNHRRLHTGEKPYKCDVCNVAFPSLSGLSQHRFSRHQKPFYNPYQ